jgi:hypothetical protein
LGFEIVGLGVNYYRAANDRFGSLEADDIVGHFQSGQAVLVGFKITKIANVAVFRFGTRMGHIGGIEVASCGIGFRGGAVSEFMKGRTNLSVRGLNLLFLDPTGSESKIFK